MVIIDRKIIQSHRKSRMFISLLLIIVLALSLITISFLKLQESGSYPIGSSPPVMITYTPHAPIEILNNSDFISQGWPGNGTLGSPFIIDGLEISNTSVEKAIYIAHTTAYFSISNCYFHNIGNSIVLHLENATNGYIEGNKIERSAWEGIVISNSHENIIRNNQLQWLMNGISAGNSNNNTFINNEVTNQIVQFSLGLWNCNGNYIRDNMMKALSDSTIYLDSCSGNLIENNTCYDGGNGIELRRSENNTIYMNDIYENGGRGIFLKSSSNNNSIYGNSISNNSRNGVEILSGCTGNRIWGNTFSNNNYTGTSYDPSYVQAYDSGMNNWWNTTGESFNYGNYWRDWTAPDDDAPFGIVDNPYNISGSANAKDYYPVTIPEIIPEPPIFILAGMMITISLIFSRIREKK